MAASGLSPEPSQEVFSWLKSMPLAPEYRPTLAEFQDPIAYIHKIEKEASQYGICKIVPPVAPASKKTAISNLNRSLLARNAAAADAGSKPAPTFTTRQQQIGFCPRKQRPVQKAVWQSGEVYTFQEFEAKAKSFEKSYLKKYSRKGSLSPLEVETLYWKATLDKPLTVEYANDMPGSAFVPVKGKGGKEVGEGVTVGETAWNMRGVSRAKGSLLRFMKEEIPGVTSPMVYVAMLFSWFAWHVEDHDLHSLNYLHMGAGKTWYGVPRDAAVSFEEVVRVDGYGGEINPLVTFSTLGEKTTVMSPEVFISAGIPCCRLVQNAGEFVVTFPRAYHSGFSHGFNCGEAANISTPEWLRFAKDAAIRRASINYPPMVSHFQLLYDLANELCSSSSGAPTSINKPRSSRLKDKKKTELENLVKEQFVENVIQHNNLLHILGEGSAVVLLPEGSTDTSVCSDLRVGSQSSVEPKMTSLCHYKGSLRPAKGLLTDDDILGAKNDIKLEKGFHLLKGNFASPYERNKNFSLNKSDYMCNLPFLTKPSPKTENGVAGDALSDQRLFSCVTCGIVCFACAAVIQPIEPAARYLMSADCSFFNDWTVGSGVTRDDPTVAQCDAVPPELNSSSRWTDEETSYHLAVKSDSHHFPMANQSNGLPSDPKKKDTSALVLLASAYGNSSDSEEDHVEEDVAHTEDDMNLRNFSAEVNHSDSENHDHSLPRLDSRDRHAADCDPQPTSGGDDIKWRSPQDFTVEFEAVNDVSTKSTTLEENLIVTSPNIRSGCATIALGTEKLRLNKTMETGAVSTDEDSSRLHIFCLEHAVEVEQQLRPMGGVHVFLLCHPEYPKVEAEAKLAAEELGIVHAWNDLSFRDASKEDEEKIRLALDSEEAIPGNRDWAVKLGINLFYSANLSRSILYSKQMAYNFVIYNAFGRTSPASSPTAMNVHGRKLGKQKKVVAGKWCGRVWMSTQVHPFLSEGYSDHQEQEKSSCDWALLDEIGKKPECAKKSEKAKMPRKLNRKRKMRTEVRSTEKVKAKKTEDAVSDHSLENIHNNRLPRYLRGKQPKLAENEDAASYDSLDDEFHIESTRFSKRNDLKCGRREIDCSDMVEGSAKHHKRNICGQQVKSIEKDEISDDSPGYTSCEESGRIPVSWHAKSFEREHSPLDEEEEQNSPRGNLIKNVDRDEADPSTLVPKNSIKQYKRRRTMTRGKSVQTEFKMSNDTLEDRSYKQIKRVPRNQHRKCIERDAVFSDDSLEANSLDDHRAIISKTSKFTDAVDSCSDDSLGDNSPERQRISHGSKAAEYDQREEDAVSYDSPDETGNSIEQLREISARSKKARYVEREEDVSYDSCDADVPQHSRKIPRNKRNNFYDPDDAVSYDSEDNNSPKQPRTLRDGLKKTQTRRKARPEISQQPRLRDEVAQWSSRRKKPEPVQKRNSRQEQSISDSDSCAEDDETAGGLSMRLRKRVPKPLKKTEPKPKMKKTANQKPKNASPMKAAPVTKSKGKVRAEEGAYQCDMEGCSMSFASKQELTLHKRNICPVKGCGKKFFSHKYLLQHRRVHVDDRPLKCPWKGCKMTFKWAWARTEHIRVHTGARPYVCGEACCGQTFRFVSDFSRHKRKTGHSGKKAKA